jgi:hypothetical protein
MKPVLQSRTKKPGKALARFKEVPCSGLCDTSIHYDATHKVLDFLHDKSRLRVVALHKRLPDKSKPDNLKLFLELKPFLKE